jgi:hypothetical protein
MFNPAKVNRHPKQGQTVFFVFKTQGKIKKLEKMGKNTISLYNKGKNTKIPNVYLGVGC